MASKRTSITLTENEATLLDELSKSSGTTKSEVIDLGLKQIELLFKDVGTFNFKKENEPRTVSRTLVLQNSTLVRLDLLAKQKGSNRSLLCGLAVQLYNIVVVNQAAKLSPVLDKFNALSEQIKELTREIDAMDLYDGDEINEFLHIANAYVDQGAYAIERAIKNKTNVVCDV
jgi:hypothetical protein